jgi:hypothetical protein
MPRKERSVRQHRTLVAAATNYSARSKKKVNDLSKRPGEAWQHASWDFYDLVPEYHQGCAITGALLSRAKLVVFERGADDQGREVWKPTENPVAKAALEDLFGGPEGQVEMLRQFGIHFTVAGEGWIMAPPDADADEWLVAASTEISKRSGGGWKVDDKEFPEGSTAIRVWRRHPRVPRKADAPARSILPVLSELTQLSKRISAQIDSRLFGNGLLLVPSETSFPSSPTRAINPGDPTPTITDGVQGGDAQGLADLIFDLGQEAMQNPESAAAMMPLIGEAPGEYIGNVKHITFSSDLDKTAPALRGELIRRTALGLDIPPEVLLGNAGSNHWNAWLSDENSVKIHGEPLLKLITTSLTVGWLRVALEGEDGIDDPRNFAIAADTSQMRMRPNRSKEALELHDRMILSDAATLRENGFTDADMMTPEERTAALIRKVAGGSTTPELVEAALREAGVDLDVIVSDTRAPAEARPTPSLLEHPVRGIPEQDRAAAVRIPDGLVFAAEQIVDRALQRAGNRLKSKMSLRSTGTPANRLYMGVQLSPADLDDMLADAWDSCLSFDYGVPGELLQRALNIYTRSIIRSQREPSRAGIAVALKLVLGNQAA